MSPLVARKVFGHAVDHGRGRVVADEAYGEFGGDELRGLRAGGEHVEDFEALLGPFSLMVAPRTNLGPGSCLEASNSGLDVFGGEWDACRRSSR